jgi:hypothetical protein
MKKDASHVCRCTFLRPCGYPVQQIQAHGLCFFKVSGTTGIRPIFVMSIKQNLLK